VSTACQVCTHVWYGSTYVSYAMLIPKTTSRLLLSSLQEMPFFAVSRGRCCCCFRCCTPSAMSAPSDAIQDFFISPRSAAFGDVIIMSGTSESGEHPPMTQPDWIRAPRAPLSSSASSHMHMNTPNFRHDTTGRSGRQEGLHLSPEASVPIRPIPKLTSYLTRLFQIPVGQPGRQWQRFEVSQHPIAHFPPCPLRSWHTPPKGNRGKCNRCWS
jgi:hypothetical protein